MRAAIIAKVLQDQQGGSTKPPDSDPPTSTTPEVYYEYKQNAGWYYGFQGVIVRPADLTNYGGFAVYVHWIDHYDELGNPVYADFYSKVYDGDKDETSFKSGSWELDPGWHWDCDVLIVTKNAWLIENDKSTATVTRLTVNSQTTGANGDGPLGKEYCDNITLNSNHAVLEPGVATGLWTLTIEPQKDLGWVWNLVGTDGAITHPTDGLYRGYQTLGIFPDGYKVIFNRIMNEDDIQLKIGPQLWPSHYGNEFTLRIYFVSEDSSGNDNKIDATVTPYLDLHLVRPVQGYPFEFAPAVTDYHAEVDFPPAPNGDPFQVTCDVTTPLSAAVGGVRVLFRQCNFDFTEDDTKQWGFVADLKLKSTDTPATVAYTLLGASAKYPVVSATEYWRVFFITIDLNGNFNSVDWTQTPHADITITRPTPAAAPDVLVFGLGTANQDGTFTATPKWDTLNEKMIFEWGCLLPPDVSNFSSVALFVQIPNGTWLRAPAAADWVKPKAGDAYYDAFAVGGTSVPRVPESWVFVACSANKDGKFNEDVNGNPIGPTITMQTIAPNGGVAAGNLKPGLFGNGITNDGTYVKINASQGLAFDGTGKLIVNVDSTDFQFIGQYLAMKRIDLSKAANFDPTEFQIDPNDAKLKTKILSADKIITGTLRVGYTQAFGGTAKPGQLAVFGNNGANQEVMVAWIGQNGIYYGGWFGQLYVGGSAPDSAKLVADANGNLSISGASITVIKGTTTVTINTTDGLKVVESGSAISGTLNNGYLFTETASYKGTYGPSSFVIEPKLGSSGRGSVQATVSATGGSIQVNDGSNAMVFLVGAAVNVYGQLTISNGTNSASVVVGGTEIITSGRVIKNLTAGAGFAMRKWPNATRPAYTDLVAGEMVWFYDNGSGGMNEGSGTYLVARIDTTSNMFYWKATGSY